MLLICNMLRLQELLFTDARGMPAVGRLTTCKVIGSATSAQDKFLVDNLASCVHHICGCESSAEQ